MQRHDHPPARLLIPIQTKCFYLSYSVQAARGKQACVGHASAGASEPSARAQDATPTTTTTCEGCPPELRTRMGAPGEREVKVPGCAMGRVPGVPLSSSGPCGNTLAQLCAAAWATPYDTLRAWRRCCDERQHRSIPDVASNHAGVAAESLAHDP